MSWRNVTFEEMPGPKALLELMWPNLKPGIVSATRTIRITNSSASPAFTMTLVRLVVKPLHGHFALSTNELGTFLWGTDEQGREAVGERWVEARVGAAAFQAIGGAYGNGSLATNYLALANLAPAATVDIDLRVNVPANASTARFARVRLGLSYLPV